MLFKPRVFLVVLTALSFFRLAAFNDERITFFDCSITIHNDNSLTVTETITVVATGNLIKRGIVREFPTRYKTWLDFNFNMGFMVKNITMNNKLVPYKLKSYGTGTKIYIGDPQRIIPLSGTYTFQITYHATWALAFFKDHDELYWNVTGNNWRLPIDSVRTQVILPPGIPNNMVQLAAYTGYQGEQQQAFHATTKSDGSVVFETTQTLWQGQGLTIVVGWPKGYIPEPTFIQRWAHFIGDNIEIIGLLILLLFFILYLLFLYFICCRCYKESTIIPHFQSPAGLSPGSVYYINNMGYGSKALAAEIVDMARAGYLKIECEKSGFWSYEYYLQRAKPSAADTDRQADSMLYKKVTQILFAQHGKLKLNSTNQDILEKVRDYLKIYYGNNFDNPYFITLKNQYYIALGTFYALAAVPAASLYIRYNWPYILIILAIAAPFLFELCSFFKKYTQQGEALVAHIQGFKMFLETTELERLKIIGTPPTKTPKLYETYLPYAIALGVEEAWTAQFAPVFEEMKRHGTAYSPSWYRGHGRSFNVHNFSRNIASSIHKVSSPSKISSTSGLGGRGSSGGGRGGGGGGGW